MHFPILYLKTPMIEEKIQQGKRFYIVKTKLEAMVYKIKEDDYRAVITKDIVFNNNHSETVLLKYINGMKSCEDTIDLVDDFMDNYHS